MGYKHFAFFYLLEQLAVAIYDKCDDALFTAIDTPANNPGIHFRCASNNTVNSDLISCFLTCKQKCPLIAYKTETSECTTITPGDCGPSTSIIVENGSQIYVKEKHLCRNRTCELYFELLFKKPKYCICLFFFLSYTSKFVVVVNTCLPRNQGSAVACISCQE